jgi:putative transposase
MHGSFLYLLAVLDWFSRFVISWELSNTKESGFCLTALEAAFRFGQPEIWNSDQGSQFTAAGFLMPPKDRAASESVWTADVAPWTKSLSSACGAA